MFRPLPLPLALKPQSVAVVGATRLTPALASPEPLRMASDTKPNEDCPNSCPEPFNTRNGNPLATETIGESCHPPTTRLAQVFCERNGTSQTPSTVSTYFRSNSEVP